MGNPDPLAPGVEGEPLTELAALAAGNMRGIAAMLVSMVCFVLNDTLVKLASADLPLGELIFIRGLMASLAILLLAKAFGALPSPRRLLLPAVGLRLVGELGSTLFYLLALVSMQIANVTAILQAVPLAATVGAALFLGEPVGWRRWLAVSAGLVGVLLIVRPGLEGFNGASMFALVSILFIVLRDLSTRRIPTAVHTLALTAVTAVTVTLMGLAMMPFAELKLPSGYDLLLLAAAAVLLNAGYYFIVIAMRTGEMAVIAPFRYSIVIWALLIGFVVWGDIPALPAIAGIVIVSVAGIYTFFRERAVKAAKAAAGASRVKADTDLT